MARVSKGAWMFSVGMCMGGWMIASAASIPDLNGTWQIFPDPYGDATNDLFAPDPPPPGGEPPLKEPYASAYKSLLKRQKAANAQGKPLATASSRCLPEGMPTLMSAHYALEFLQTPGRVTVIAEFMAEIRRIYLNEKLPAVEDVAPSYAGYSVGRWNGDILEVETVGVRPDVRYLDIPHTAKMKIQERIHLTAPDLIQDDITITDPEVLTRPYKFTYGYKKDPGYRITEYICEDNHVVVDQDGSFKLKVAPQEKPSQGKPK